MMCNHCDDLLMIRSCAARKLAVAGLGREAVGRCEHTRSNIVTTASVNALIPDGTTVPRSAWDDDLNTFMRNTGALIRIFETI